MYPSKALAIFALMCYSASAAAACAEDDLTSLVQVKQVVKHSGERSPDEETELVEASSEKQPVHDLYAITDSTPANLDNGKVASAFTANMKKAMGAVEAKTKSDLEFTNAQRNARNAAYTKAKNHVAATEAAVASAQKADEAAVQKTAAARSAVVKAAMKRVAEAKESAEAHAYKKRQAQEAAVLGRQMGTAEAETLAKESREDMESAWAAQDAEAARQQARAYLKKQKMMEEAAVLKATENREEAEASWVSGADKWKVAAEAKGAADAAVEEEAIEGPEGLKNHITDFDADQAIHEYKRATAADESSIEASAGSK